MHIQAFQVTPFMTNCFLLVDNGEALVVDPGEMTPPIVRALAGLNVRAIVNTHCHCDHCGGNADVKNRTGADLLCHKAELPLLQALPQQGAMFGVPFPPSPEPDRFIDQGDTVQFGSVTLQVLHAPGHSPGHIVLLGADALRPAGYVLAGDVLFAGSIGRTDLPGGNYEKLIDTIRTKLMPLPDDTIVYCGHGPETTIGEERLHNPFLADL